MKLRILSLVLQGLGWAGLILFLCLVGLLGCSTSTSMNTQESLFKKGLINHPPATISPESQEQGVQRVTEFLANLHQREFIEENTSKVYAKDAYFNDTLVTLDGSAEIQKHFIKTAAVMTEYSLEVEDVSETKDGVYLRWTMTFAAPKVAKGKAMNSIGMTYLRFDETGKVSLHQDFWDSTSGFFEHLPLIGNSIRFVKKKL